MEFKGTKGKWILREEFDIHYDQPILTVSCEDVDDLCTIWSGQNKGEAIKESVYADALLISKAPELLEMLIKILEKDFDFDYYSEIEQLIKEATEI